MERVAHPLAAFLRSARAFPERLAFDGQHEQVSFGETAQGTAQIAAALHALGVAAGDRVAICSANSVPMVIAYVAAMRAGAVAVAVNAAFEGPELRAALEETGTAVVCVDDRAWSRVEPLLSVLPQVRIVVRLPARWHDRDAPSPAAAGHGRPRILPLTDLLYGRGVREEVACRPDAPAVIAFTSGTTGGPRGVIHSNRNLTVSGEAWIRHFDVTPADRILCPLPLFQLPNMIGGPLLSLRAGCVATILDRFDPEVFLNVVQQQRVTFLAAVPAMYYALAERADLRRDLRHVRVAISGGAPLPAATRDDLSDGFGLRISSVYGMTEAPAMVTADPPGGTDRVDAVGRALPHLAVQVRGGDDRPVAQGEVGEVAIGPLDEPTRSPWADLATAYRPMLGYWGRPAETEVAVRHEFYYSGDLGRLDPDGHLVIVGRLRDLIIVGGFNVTPSEVESVLALDPRVAEVGVVGLPDPRLGEVPVAAVVLRPGASAHQAELIALCRAHLAHYKMVRRIVFCAELPRNAMGKLVRRQLLTLFRES